MSNVNMDPAANPWGNTTSPPNNNIFGGSTSQSPDSSNNIDAFGMSTSSTSNSGATNVYGQDISNPNYGQGGGGPMAFDLDMKEGDRMPILSATDSTEGDGGQSAGEVFMGVQSPVPGGWPGWKWGVGGGDGR